MTGVKVHLIGEGTLHDQRDAARQQQVQAGASGAPVVLDRHGRCLAECPVDQLHVDAANRAGGRRDLRRCGDGELRADGDLLRRAVQRGRVHRRRLDGLAHRNRNLHRPGEPGGQRELPRGAAGAARVPGRPRRPDDHVLEHAALGRCGRRSGLHRDGDVLVRPPRRLQREPEQRLGLHRFRLDGLVAGFRDLHGRRRPARRRDGTVRRRRSSSRSRSAAHRRRASSRSASPQRRPRPRSPEVPPTWCRHRRAQGSPSAPRFRPRAPASAPSPARRSPPSALEPAPSVRTRRATRAIQAAPQVWQSFAVGLAPQTISFTSSPPASATVGDPDYSVGASATSGLAVIFSAAASSAGICTLSGSTVTFVAAGTCTVNADQPGDATYDVAPRVQQSFTIGGPAAPSVPVDQLHVVCSVGRVRRWLHLRRLSVGELRPTRQLLGRSGKRRAARCPVRRSRHSSVPAPARSAPTRAGPRAGKQRRRSRSPSPSTSPARRSASRRRRRVARPPAGRRTP